MKTSELIGPALDWAVAKADHPVYSDKALIFALTAGTNSIGMEWNAFSPSTDWEQGGPIIDEWAISLCPDEFITGDTRWCAVCTNEAVGYEAFGPTALIAAMRAYVASKLGDEVEVPKELS